MLNAALAGAELSPAQQLAEAERKLVPRLRAIHHVWPDFPLRGCTTQSIATVKADAAHRSFTALGRGITWAVLDSGIDGQHARFRLHGNIDPASPYHKDFTGLAATGSALRDQYGHGTHVAGIIAGEQSLAKGARASEMVCVWRELDELGSPPEDLPPGEEPDEPQGSTRKMALEAICGVAPKCQLVSLKVLDRFGMGNDSNAITAIAHVQEINYHGRKLHTHSVNLSLGYPFFDPKWFACGHSPLCVEVDRLVRSGVVIVVAAGNSGYGTLVLQGDKTADSCLDLTILAGEVRPGRQAPEHPHGPRRHDRPDRRLPRLEQHGGRRAGALHQAVHQLLRPDKARPGLRSPPGRHRRHHLAGAEV